MANAKRTWADPLFRCHQWISSSSLALMLSFGVLTALQLLNLELVLCELPEATPFNPQPTRDWSSLAIPLLETLACTLFLPLLEEEL